LTDLGLDLRIILKLYINGIGYDDVEWIHVVQDKNPVAVTLLSP
jgi:hypothetical protein